MRIMVTGGAGFIGSHTVDALVAAGNSDIVVVDNLSSGRKENLNPQARLVQLDLADREAVRHVVARERPEVLYHLAAQIDVRRSVADPVADAEVNVVGMLNLLESCRTNGLRRVIFASSGGAIYGEQEVFPCDESHPCRPLSPYGAAKLAGETYLHFYYAQYGIEYVALRYANVYGPRQDPYGEAGVVAIFCARLIRGQKRVVFGDGEQTRDYVFVEDVARANVAALHRGQCEVINIGTGIETSVNELDEILARSAGVQEPPEHGPQRPGEQRRSCISAARARAVLGWEPRVSLREGLARTLESFRVKLAEN